MEDLSLFRKFITTKKLFKETDRLLLAVSGGKDSVYMTHLFSALNFHFGIAHCNFKLRGSDSDGDEEFVQQLAEELNVPFYSKTFDTAKEATAKGESIQMAARTLRFGWFEELRIAEGFDFICIAQHQTDSLETVLFNLTRGTGIAGLHGIQVINGKIIRPLLCFTAAQVKQFVEQRNLSFREDASNNEVKYARNKIRLQVLPVLRSINPSLDTAVFKSSQRFLEMENFLNHQFEEFRKKWFIPQKNNCFSVQLAHLFVFQENSYFLYELFKPFLFTETLIQDLQSCLLNKRVGSFLESSTHRLTVDRNQIFIAPLRSTEEFPLVIDKLPFEINWFGDRYLLKVSDHIDDFDFKPLDRNRVKLDAEKLTLPLTLRSWQFGDSFTPLGMKGRKKVSDYFTDQKIPLQFKNEIPLLINKNKEIISVGVKRIADQFKITKDTKKVLIFEQL